MQRVRSVKEAKITFYLFIWLTNVYVLQHVVGTYNIKVKSPNYNYRLKYKCSEYTINMGRRQK